MKTFTKWRPPLLWRFILVMARAATSTVSRLEITGSIGEHPHGAIMAVNHIGNFDPIAQAAACARRGIAARFLAMEELFSVPIVGAVLRHGGHIRVDRNKPTAPRALHDAKAALDEGSILIVYPEGRIGLDPHMWPERGKTGTGRLALATGATLIPVAIWGSHEVLPYSSPRGVLRGVWRAIRRRPTVKVHFGQPLDLSDMDITRAGAAQRVTDRLMDAIAAELALLREAEPDLPRHIDPTRRTETRRARTGKAAS